MATESRQCFTNLTLDGQLYEILQAAGSGGGGDSDVAVGPDGVTRVPLNVNSSGELKVNVEASIDADLADIENALATTNGILTTTAADTAAIKTQLATGSVAVTGAFFQATQPVSGTVTANTGLSQPLTDTQLRATPVSVTGTLTDTAVQTQPAVPVRQVSQMTDGAGFGAVGSSVLDPYFNAPIVSGSVTYNQAAGSLNIVAGTTTNSEFLARSVKSYRGSMRMKFGIIASQRIVNNSLAVMLADLIGEGLAYTINSTTSVTVAIPSHTFNATNVGQFIQFGGITSAAAVPGRYAIASVVAGVSIDLTVSGFPASGSGTCTLFGRNYIRNLVTGATATAINVDAQRNGWATGDTAAPINTTAGVGTLVQAEMTGREVFWSDTLRASSITPTVTTRASRYENIPDAETELYVFAWSFNGTTAPASSTTFTLGSVSVESFPNNSVYLQGMRSMGLANMLPVFPTGGTIATVTSVTSVTAANLAIPGIIADTASTAISATATTATITPTFGNSFIVNFPVTVVTGTSPTLDVDVETSDDTGTNWFKVYSFPRITAVGIYRSPKISFNGNRVRYVQTIGGTSPSFTRSINRLQCSDSVDSIRQLIDRSIVLTTLNSATPSVNIQNCRNAQLVVNIGAATVAPILQLQGSDDNGLSFYSVGTPLTAVASSTVQATVANVNSQLLRAIVSTAGTTVTAGYVLIKGF